MHQGVSDRKNVITQKGYKLMEDIKTMIIKDRAVVEISLNLSAISQYY